MLSWPEYWREEWSQDQRVVAGGKWEPEVDIHDTGGGSANRRLDTSSFSSREMVQSGLVVSADPTE